MIKERLKIAREHLNISNADIARAVGITRQSVGSWGATRPRYESLKRLEEKFGINPDWLMTGDGEMMVSENKEDPIFTEVKKAFPKLSDDQKDLVLANVRQFLKAH